jgi:uncharacterized protein
LKLNRWKNFESYINEEGFFWACENGHLEVAKWLLSVKPDIEISDSHWYYSDEYCPLDGACENGHLEVAKWLLSVKPDIDITDNFNNENAFWYACAGGHLEIAKWLLSINTDIKNSDDQNAFKIACQDGHLEVAKWLLSIKPDIDISIRNDCVFAFVVKMDI